MKLRILSVARLSLPLAMAIAALLGAPSAQAVNLWWDTNGVTTTAAAATGTWTAGSAANWTTVLAGNLATAAVTTTNADDLTFNATGMTTGTITVSGTQLARTITFNTATTLSGGTAINLGSAAPGSGLFFGNVANTFNTPIVLNSAATAIAITNTGNQTQTFGGTGTITGDAASGTQTITVNTTAAAINLNGIISNGVAGGNVALTLNSSFTGVTTLAAANTYTGPTNIVAGTLAIGNAGTFASTSAINLSSTGRLNLTVANQSLAKVASGSGVVAGSFLRYSQPQATGGTGPGTIFGTVELNNSGVNPDYILDFGSGSVLTNLVASTYTSALTLSGTASIDASAAVAAYTTGGIAASTAGTKILNLTGSNTGLNTISGGISDGSGVIGITKGGAGTWFLSGTNTYTGNTLVSGGTLQFSNQVSLYNNAAAAAWTNANINVSSGATMAFDVGSGGLFTKADIVSLLGLSNSPTNGFNTGARLGLDTTAGDFLYDSVIADTNGGANVLGLTKLGGNILILDKDNTYTGRTVISGGTLQLGSGGTTGKLSPGSVIQNNGNLTINRSNPVAQGTDFSSAPITGTGSFTQAGAGTTTLSAANTFSGITTISAGVLNLTNALALQNSALITTGAGTVTFTGFTTPVFGGLSGGTGDLTAIIPGFNSASLTLNPTSGSTFTYGGVISNGVPGMTLTKNGAGTQVLNGAAVNTFTGGLILNGGTLLGDFANLATPTNLIDPTNVLTLGGGTLSLTAKFDAPSLQTFASTTLTANASSKITLTHLGAGTITVDLKAITRGAGSILNFTTIPDTTSRFALTTNGNTNDILGSWATVGATTALQYAANNGSGQIVGLGATGTTAATAGTAGTLANVTSDTTNFTYAAAATVAGSLTGNTLRYTGAASTTALGTNGLTLNGLLNAGSAALTITGTAGSPGLVIGSSGELDIISNAQTINLNSVISGTGNVVFNSAGTISLGVTNFTNTYTGSTVINSGTLTFIAGAGAATPFFGTGPVTVNSGATLGLGRTVLANAITLNSATVTAGNSFTSFLNGPITLGGISTVNITGNLTINGNIDGTGGMIKSGGITVPVLGTSNTYTGPTIINAGALRFKSSIYGNDPALWIPANITVASGASLVLNVGGAGEFTLDQIDTMFSNLANGVNNNGLLAGSLRGIDTSTLGAGGTTTYTEILADSSGPGGGPVGIKHFGVGTLELTGANTYTGPTITDGNGTLKVSSLNSVFTNPTLGTVRSASSSLGAPTTVANGTIGLGQTTFQGASLTYTGTGETTDRVFNLGGANGTNYTFDQSGSGLLKFISPFTINDNRGVKTIILQGSTAGTGEISSVILNGDILNPNRVTKSGTGTWTLSGANLYAGVTTVNGGALVLANANALNGGIGATGGLSNLTFNGGVVGLAVGDFTRSLNTAATVSAATFTGNGGWAAYGADRLVNLGGASASIAWATANTGFNARTVILGNATATHMVTLQNPLNLGTAARTVQVDDGAAPIDGTLSGILSSGTGGGLTKTGTGILALTASNDYTGGTTVSDGTLILAATGSIATSSSINLAKSAVIDTTSQPFAIPATQAVSFNLDPTDAGTSGRIKAAALNITNAVVTLTASAPLDDAVYILADYTSLAGIQFASVSLLTGSLAGYSINYAYNGGTQIALVPATGYELWAGFNAGGQGFNLDFDNDGVPNGIEYFMGQTGSTFTPNPSIVNGKITWPYDATATGITYKVTTSTGLNIWTPVDPQPVPSGGTLEFTVPTTEPRLFIRLEVLKTP